MNADHDQFIREHLAKSPQLRDIMMAINSAKGPEFEQHNFAAQCLDCQRLLDVDPIQPGCEFGGVDLATIALHVMISPVGLVAKEYTIGMERWTGSEKRKIVAETEQFRPLDRLCTDYSVNAASG